MLWWSHWVSVELKPRNLWVEGSNPRSATPPLSSHHVPSIICQATDNLSPSLMNNVTAVCVWSLVLYQRPWQLPDGMLWHTHTHTVSLSSLQNLFWQLLLGADLQPLQGFRHCVWRQEQEWEGEQKTCQNVFQVYFHFHPNKCDLHFSLDKIENEGEKRRTENKKKRLKSYQSVSFYL